MAAEGKWDELKKWLKADTFNEAEKVIAVKRIYDHLGIEGITRDKMNEYFDHGMADLKKVMVAGERKQLLSDLANLLMKRES